MVIIGNLWLVILDEFMVGFDVMVCCEFWFCICVLVVNGMLVLLIIYYFEEVDVLFDCIVVLVKGWVVVEGVLEVIKV